MIRIEEGIIGAPKAMDEVLRFSPGVWTIFDDDEPVFGCGVFQQVLLTLPEFWLLEYRAFRERPRKYVREAIRLLPQLLDRYPTVVVRTQTAAGNKLIRLAGFHHVHQADGIDFYEARKWIR